MTTPSKIIHYRRSFSDGQGNKIFKDPKNRCLAKGKFSWDLSKTNCETCLEIEKHFNALAEKVVKAQAELNARLNSPDPEIRAAAEKQIIDGGVAFITDIEWEDFKTCVKSLA